MNRIVIIIGVLIVLALTVGFMNGNKKFSDSGIQKLTFAEVQSNVAAGAILYDVRTPAEYTDGHFEDAIDFNVEDMSAGQIPDLPKDKKIYVYCRSGSRSSQATSILKSAGFTDVNDLGGLSKVQSIGGKLIK